MPIFQVLERLANCPDVYVVVISGRELDDLRQKVDVEGITYAACHGLHVMHADGQTYRHTISQGTAQENVRTTTPGPLFMIEKILFND